MPNIITIQSKSKSLVIVFRQYMLDYGHECEVKESDSFVTIDALRQYLVENCVSCILGIHALHAGKLLRGSCIEWSEKELCFLLYVMRNWTDISYLSVVTSELLKNK